MHILNGDSAAGCFRQAFHPPQEELLVFRDVLSCGRLKAYVDIKQWAKYRRDYWAAMYVKQGFDGIDDIATAPNDFYNDFDQLKCADKINLWVGCALSDHLLLVFLVKLFDVHGLDFSKLAIYQYTHADNNLTVIGLGILSPEQIEALKPESLRLNDAQIAFCLEVWEIVTAGNPEDLMRILKLKQASLPLLHSSLKSLFYRFPKLSNGLSHFDELILNAAKDHAPNTLRIIAEAMTQDMYPDKYPHIFDVVGDTYLFDRLKNMAQASLKKPLLSLNAMDESLRETTTKITEFGLEVLKGKQNVVDVNGIDDWVGGIHLTIRSGSAWFRDGDKLILQACHSNT